MTATEGAGPPTSPEPRAVSVSSITSLASIAAVLVLAAGWIREREEHQDLRQEHAIAVAYADSTSRLVDRATAAATRSMDLLDRCEGGAP